mmetsp:Transcript_44029/g.114502  ORF Transcript_44029/g.114502 Transcript_44029/m.114502 type:complete len:201 (-) Transcript_44029:1171-1773(-)
MSWNGLYRAAIQLEGKSWPSKSTSSTSLMSAKPSRRPSPSPGLLWLKTPTNTNWFCWAAFLATPSHFAANGRQPRQHPQRSHSLSLKQVMQLAHFSSHVSTSGPLQLVFPAHDANALAHSLYTHSLHAALHLLSTGPSSSSSPAPMPPSPLPWMHPTHMLHLSSHLLYVGDAHEGSLKAGLGMSGQVWALSAKVLVLAAS